ncbi:antiviral innate immune response effector IFIT1-like [Sander vitreus]
MMSAAQSQTTLESKLEALQCHFTWEPNPISTFKLYRLRDKLEDIGTEEGNSWLGHIYNLWGFIQYKLGSTEDAQSFFNKAAEAFSKIRNADEGPWLVVNYGNLAWLHHHLGDQAESQVYLSKVDALMNKYPSPSQDELHPEIYAEKGWTLMTFSSDKKLAVDYFQRAIRMQPDMVEWNTSYILGLVDDFKYSNTGVEADLLEKMRIVKEQVPDNLYFAVLYLQQRAKKGERIEDEIRELAREILLRNPVSSYSGIRPLLGVYIKHVSIDEAIDLAEEALDTHPGERYLKKCLAYCYKWKIFSSRSSESLDQGLIDKAISLHEEVISLYPDCSFVKKINLAKIYANLNNGQDKAEQIYKDLLERDLEPADKQMLYNIYAKHVYFNQQDSEGSLRYHMQVAMIPLESIYRETSITTLKKHKNRSPMCREIEELLATLQEP